MGGVLTNPTTPKRCTAAYSKAAFTGNSVWLRSPGHPSESEVYNRVCAHIFSSLTFAYYTFVLNWIIVSVSHPARGIAGANIKGASLGKNVL